jgi:hypothetical protein
MFSVRQSGAHNETHACEPDPSNDQTRSVLGKGLSVLPESELFEPVRNLLHCGVPGASTRLRLWTRRQRIIRQIPAHYATDLNGPSGHIFASRRLSAYVPAPALTMTYRGVLL